MSSGWRTPRGSQRREELRHVGRLHEADAGDDAVEAVARARAPRARLSPAHPRDVLGDRPRTARPARAAPGCASCGAAARWGCRRGRRHEHRRAAARAAAAPRRCRRGTGPRASVPASITVDSSMRPAPPRRHDDEHAAAPIASGNQPPSTELDGVAPRRTRGRSPGTGSDQRSAVRRRLAPAVAADHE